MHWISIPTTLLFVHVSAAAVAQKPFLPDEPDKTLTSSAGAFRLRPVIANAFYPLPVGKPCYPPKSTDQCFDVNQNKTNDLWIPDQPGGYFYANWPSCQAQGQTCALTLNNSDTIPSTARCFNGSMPQQMIDLSTLSNLTDAILEAFDYARKTDIPLIIKNTGHDWKGRSSAPGSLALWTHKLQTPNVPMILHQNFQPSNCTTYPEEIVVEVGAGEQWGNIYEFAQKNGLAVLGGTCPSVGIAGWLSGGGHSPLTPVFGMGVDNVRQVELATPRGDILIATECQNEDLFFAVRGGGGGTFGVITKIWYQTIEKFELQEFTAAINGLDRADVQELFEILTTNAVGWSRAGWGGYIKSNATGESIEIVNPSKGYTLADARHDMEPLTKFFVSRVVQPNITTRGSWYDYFEDHFKPLDKHIGGWSAAVSSRLLPPEVFHEDTRPELAKALVQIYESKPNLNLWLMLVTPTKFPHTNNSALHPSWKNAILEVRINERWDQYPDQSAEANRQHFKRVHEAMEPLRKLAPNMAVSINEADIWEQDSHLAYWGQDNHDRLRCIKKRVDPENILSNYGAVNWDQNAERYHCYPRL